jgi:hypothetical protein
MVKLEILGKAIAAHASWKARLHTAVSTGKFDVPAGTVKSDAQYEFGKWLHGPELSAAEKQSENYRNVKQLHAQFDVDAAKVVELVTSGQKDAAAASLNMGGTYAKSSTKLTEAMVRWRQSVQ